MTRTLNGVEEQLRLYSDGTEPWWYVNGSRVRPATQAEVEEAKRAFWNLL
jgi:hypothetical protein